jgi:hypothetical protein
MAQFVAADVGRRGSVARAHVIRDQMLAMDVVSAEFAAPHKLPSAVFLSFILSPTPFS